MQQTSAFDPSHIYGIAADNLLSQLGPKALHYTDMALQKMKDIGDDAGLEHWLNIYAHLSAKAAEQQIDHVFHQANVSSQTH